MTLELWKMHLEKYGSFGRPITAAMGYYQKKNTIDQVNSDPYASQELHKFRDKQQEVIDEMETELANMKR